MNDKNACVEDIFDLIVLSPRYRSIRQQVKHIKKQVLIFFFLKLSV
jgi:hypothetical protein